MKITLKIMAILVFLGVSMAYSEDLSGEHDICHEPGAEKGNNTCSSCDTMSTELAD